MTLPPLLRWSPGRQGAGYRKLPIARGKTWDVYVIDYPAGSSVPAHFDPVADKRHYRINVVVLGRTDAFYIEPHQRDFGVFWRRGRFALFRPDAVAHGVSAVRSRRIVISIGWVRDEKKETK